ncbi:MAG TPA: amino acid permease [Thermoanaerobaculia bacterium]
MAAPSSPTESGLRRTLGAWDGTLITVGSVVGTGIFLVGSDLARAVPHAGLVLAIWLAGGLLSLAGALTYAELGTMYPRAGGIYLFLREAYGPLAGFLYGWASFLVIMSGGIAAISVGTARYLGYFLPFSSPERVVVALPLGGWTWSVSGAQVVAAAIVLGLTAINHFGVRGGTATQNLLTVAKVGAIGLFVAFGLLVPARADNALFSNPFAVDGAGGLALAGLGVAMIAVLWTYDGWYGLTFSAGEMRRPERDLPLGLVGGTAIVTALYLLLSWIYFRALPIAAMADEPRVAEAAGTALFGVTGGRAVALLVTVSSLGCAAATILYSSRIYQPMAADGVFFRSLAAIHPRYQVPTRSLWAQTAWTVVLTLSGTYDQIYTYVVFVAVLFHVGACGAVFVLRRKRPDLPRPYRVWGYPWVPIAFLAASFLLVGSTLYERPVESIAGLGILALGLPAYAYWRRAAPR